MVPAGPHRRPAAGGVRRDVRVHPRRAGHAAAGHDRRRERGGGRSAPVLRLDQGGGRERRDPQRLGHRPGRHLILRPPGLPRRRPDPPARAVDLALVPDPLEAGGRGRRLLRLPRLRPAAAARARPARGRAGDSAVLRVAAGGGARPARHRRPRLPQGAALPRGRGVPRRLRVGLPDDGHRGGARAVRADRRRAGPRPGAACRGPRSRLVRGVGRRGRPGHLLAPALGGRGRAHDPRRGRAARAARPARAPRRRAAGGRPAADRRGDPAPLLLDPRAGGSGLGDRRPRESQVRARLAPLGLAHRPAAAGAAGPARLPQAPAGLAGAGPPRAAAGDGRRVLPDQLERPRHLPVPLAPGPVASAGDPGGGRHRRAAARGVVASQRPLGRGRHHRAARARGGRSPEPDPDRGSQGRAALSARARRGGGVRLPRASRPPRRRARPDLLRAHGPVPDGTRDLGRADQLDAELPAAGGARRGAVLGRARTRGRGQVWCRARAPASCSRTVSSAPISAPRCVPTSSRFAGSAVPRSTSSIAGRFSDGAGRVDGGSGSPCCSWAGRRSPP